MTRAEDGSILVEALVSTAIVATILAATYRIVADSAARHQKVEARRYALLVARSELAATGTEVPLQSGVVEGAEAGYAWRIEMQPCSTGTSAAGVLYCVSVSVRSASAGP